jgi:hypothetical protein
VASAGASVASAGASVAAEPPPQAESTRLANTKSTKTLFKSFFILSPYELLDDTSET